MVANTSLSELVGIPLQQESGLGPLTLAGFITELASRHSEREALCWYDLDGQRCSWNYRELFNESRRVARSLLACGVGKDTRVGVLISNRPEWLFTLFGIAMAGGVTVALNTFSTRSELRHQLQVADVELVIAEAEVAGKRFMEDLLALAPALAEVAPGQLMAEDLPFLRRVVCIDAGEHPAGIQDWRDFLSVGDAVPATIVDATSAASSPVDQGVIFFSSGSTALPKAILQSQRAATLQCWRLGKLFETDDSTRTFPANGFFFSGNFAQAFGTLSTGGCLVLLRYFEPDRALELIQREKVSCVVAWGHQEARLVECEGWARADFSALRRVNFNSVLRSHPTANVQWAGFNGFGMTETFTFVTAASGANFRDGSFGDVFPGNVLRIVDQTTGKVLPRGETGEIIVKGPTLMMGYLKIPPEDSFDNEGFIHTKDAGCIDDRGELQWKGRLSEIIKTGGANVSPTEIDAVLTEHPAIQSVFTVGVPDDLLGEIVVSCVILRESHELTEEELRRYGRQFLASYKVPRRVLFLRQEQLPMTGSNKVRRAELRVLAEELLASDAAG